MSVESQVLGMVARDYQSREADGPELLRVCRKLTQAQGASTDHTLAPISLADGRLGPV